VSLDRARSRRTDPATSVDAARLVEGNGSAVENRRKLLAAVKHFPHQTAAEYSALTGIDRHEVSRRLPELRPLFIINDPEPKRCTIKHTMAMTWSPRTDEDPQAKLFE
jgi:hypothetical protein